MKKVSTLIASLIMTFAFTAALAAPGASGHGGDNPLRKLGHAVRQLDLNEDQRNTIRDIFDSNREVLMAQAEADRDLKGDFRDLVMADTLDTDALQALASLQGQLAEERMLITGQVFASVLGELTDEQRSELEALGENRRNERKERRYSDR